MTERRKSKTFALHFDYVTDDEGKWCVQIFMGLDKSYGTFKVPVEVAEAHLHNLQGAINMVDWFQGQDAKKRGEASTPICRHQSTYQ